MPVPGRKCRACERRPSTLPPGRGARARLARALRGERALALPETAHLPHAAPDVDREDVRVLVEAGRPGPAPATLGEPAGPLAAQHRDDEKVRELPHQLVDVGKALAGADPELGRLPVVLAAAAVVRHRSRGSFRPEAWEARRSRGARSATDPIYFNLRAVLPRARCSAAAARPRPGRPRPSPAAAGEVRSALSQASPGRRLRVPRAAPGPRHAFPGAAPAPPHATMPHERAPRVDGREIGQGSERVKDYFHPDVP